jgi:hypothetical protein
LFNNCVQFPKHDNGIVTGGQDCDASCRVEYASNLPAVGGGSTGASFSSCVLTGGSGFVEGVASVSFGSAASHDQCDISDQLGRKIVPAGGRTCPNSGGSSSDNRWASSANRESFSVADNQRSNHQISESGTENSSSSSSGVDAESVEANSFDTIPVIAYPAPIPKFSALILSALTAGLKVSVMSVYSELIKECASFYSPICSTEISKARKSLENIGKTLTEKFPVLVTSDGAKPWSFFNSRLSVALRNKRNRIAGKLTSASALSFPAKCAAPVAKCSASFTSTSATVQTSTLGIMKLTKPLTTDEYEEHVEKLKTDFSRQDHHPVLMKELLALTHKKRREWIDSSKSTDLRLSTIVKKFPCFTATVFLRYELASLVGQDKVDKFIGKLHMLVIFA